MLRWFLSVVLRGQNAIQRVTSTKDCLQGSKATKCQVPADDAVALNMFHTVVPGSLGDVTAADALVLENDDTLPSLESGSDCNSEVSTPSAFEETADAQTWEVGPPPPCPHCWRPPRHRPATEGTWKLIPEPRSGSNQEVAHKFMELNIRGEQCVTGQGGKLRLVRTETKLMLGGCVLTFNEGHLHIVGQSGRRLKFARADSERTCPHRNRSHLSTAVQAPPLRRMRPP